MSNMSYCRFENTVSDLDDCYEVMGEDVSELSDTEKDARERLIRKCCNIAARFGDE